jgi:hypothetical protein
VFLVNPPIIALMLLFVRRLPEARSAGGQRLDVAGVLLITASLGALMFGLSNGQQHGFTSPATLAALAIAVALAAGFVVVEQTVSAPMLPAAILASRARRRAVMAMLLIGAVLAGDVYFVSIYLQHVERFSPLETSLALVPSTVTVVLSSTLLTRRLIARTGIKRVFVLGLVSMAVGSLVAGYRLSFLVATVMALVAAALVAAGLGTRDGRPVARSRRTTDGTGAPVKD